MVELRLNANNSWSALGNTKLVLEKDPWHHNHQQASV